MARRPKGISCGSVVANTRGSNRPHGEEAEGRLEPWGRTQRLKSHYDEPQPGLSNRTNIPHSEVSIRSPLWPTPGT
jgi:hypothetical protein